MPRANRTYLPGLVWHITHRCHDRSFLFKAEIDRANWRRWLWEATDRYGLRVLDYIVMSNHVHVLTFDVHGDRTISRSLQLVQGRTAQDFNRRRARLGAFWQDRHHAVAVDSENYLWSCLVYIDLNIVRAGAVSHPAQWRAAGYNEIQRPRSRYRVIDIELLAELTGCCSVAALQAEHRARVDETIRQSALERDARWTEAVAVGSPDYVETVRQRLGLTRQQRITVEKDGASVLREPAGRYTIKTTEGISI